MPPVIARYRAANPRIKVELYDTLAATGLSMLRDGRVDIAITAGEELQEFDCQVLRRERYFLVCRDDHPLAPHAPLPGAQPWGDGGWRVEGNCTLLGHRHWRGSLVVTGVLAVGAGALVQGDIKAHRGIVIGEGAVVTGSVISDSGVRVFCDAVIGGPVLAETVLELGSGARLGSPQAPTSVSAGTLLVDDGVLVHGSVQAAQAGQVRGTAWA